MAEELRVFIRIALYVILVGVIYWVVSYEEAGTALLWCLGAGAVFFAAAVGSMVRGRRPPVRDEERGALDAVNQAIGFGERPSGELDVEDEPIPPASVWPATAALGALFVALGLIYGPWFWLPGAGVAALSAWGWLTELTR